MTFTTNKTAGLQQELEHRIVHGLACEWEAALWVLDDCHRRGMQKPLFSLRDMDKQLGTWDPVKKEIGLSRQFVLDHPWQAVRDVLTHEVAHQIAHQVLGARHETAHGPAFKKACHLLRIDPTATGNYQTLTDGPESGASDKILIRIKKLLALAESQNSHEAEAAMLKAHELIAKYNVDLLALNRKREFISVLVSQPALRHTRDTYYLANLVQDFYFVQGVWVPSYVVDKGKMGRALEISGDSKNVEIASYVYDFISNFIRSQWRQYNRDGGHSHHRKTDFAVGILDGFRYKLDSQRKKWRRLTSRDALVTVTDPLLKEYMSYKYPHTRSFRRNAAAADPDVIRDGRVIGEDLVISKGIKEKGEGGKVARPFFKLKDGPERHLFC